MIAHTKLVAVTTGAVEIWITRPGLGRSFDLMVCVEDVEQLMYVIAGPIRSWILHKSSFVFVSSFFHLHLDAFDSVFIDDHLHEEVTRHPHLLDVTCLQSYNA